MIKISHSIENFSSGPAETKQTVPYIVFTVNDEEFGVEAQKVLELVQYITPLKMPSNFVNVQGMTIFRGKIIPIVDLRAIFGLKPIAADDNWVTIIVESSVSAFGITVERVSDLVFIPVNAIKKVTAFDYGEKLKYLKSVANFGEQMILLLDLEKIIETKTVPAIDEGTTSSFPAVPVSELLERPKEPYEETSGITQPEIPEVEPQSSSSCLIDPKELEDLLTETRTKPEQERETEESLVEGAELNEPSLPGGSVNEGYYGIVEDIQSLKIESNQSDLNLGCLDETGDLLNPQLQPEVKTDSLIPSKESDSAAKNDRLSTNWVDPVELEALLIELEKESDGKNESSLQTGVETVNGSLSEALNEDRETRQSEGQPDGILEPRQIEAILSDLEANPAANLQVDSFQMESQMEDTVEDQDNPDQTVQGLSDEVVESILKELEAWSRSRMKRPAADNSNQSLKLDQLKDTEEKPDV